MEGKLKDLEASTAIHMFRLKFKLPGRDNIQTNHRQLIRRSSMKLFISSIIVWCATFLQQRVAFCQLI